MRVRMHANVRAHATRACTHCTALACVLHAPRLEPKPQAGHAGAIRVCQEPIRVCQEPIAEKQTNGLPPNLNLSWLECAFLPLLVAVYLSGKLILTWLLDIDSNGLISWLEISLFATRCVEITVLLLFCAVIWWRLLQEKERAYKDWERGNLFEEWPLRILVEEDAPAGFFSSNLYKSRQQSAVRDEDETYVAPIPVADRDMTHLFREALLVYANHCWLSMTLLSGRDLGKKVVIKDGILVLDGLEQKADWDKKPPDCTGTIVIVDVRKNGKVVLNNGR